MSADRAPRDVVVVDLSPGARASRDPRDRWLEDDPEAIRRRLRSSRVTPGALLIPCPAHDAAVSVPCWGSTDCPGSGVCGSRVMRGHAAQASRASLPPEYHAARKEHRARVRHESRSEP